MKRKSIRCLPIALILLGLAVSTPAFTTYDEAMNAALSNHYAKKSVQELSDLQEALTLAPSDDQRMHVLDSMGSVQVKLRRTKEAAATYTQILAFTDVTPNARIRALGGMGECYLNEGSYDQAIALFRQVLDTAGADGLAVSRSLQHIAEAYVKKGDDTAALKAYLAAATNTSAPAADRLAVYQDMAALYRSRTNFNRVVEAYRSALTITNAPRLDKSRIQRQIGDIYFEQEAFDAARQAYTEALAAGDETNALAGSCLIDIGLTYLAEKNYGQASKTFRSIVETPAIRGKKQAQEYLDLCAMRQAEAKEAAPAEAPLFSFGIMSDIQYADAPPRGNRTMRQSLKNLARAVEDINTQNVEFVIQLGDLIDAGPSNYDTIQPVYERLKAKTFNVLGNHDFTMPYDQLLSRLHMPKGYYDFTVKNWRFIVLNWAPIGADEWPAGSPEAAKAQTLRSTLGQTNVNYGMLPKGLGPVQRNWLKGVLADAAGKKQKAVIFCHYPAHPKQFKSGNEYYLLADHAEVRAIMESAGCVAAFFSGHYHEGGYCESNGIHYVTLKGMVEAPLSINAYAVVRVYPDRLQVRGVGKQPSFTLKF